MVLEENGQGRELEGASLSDVLDALPAGVLVLDSDGLVRQATRTVESLLGKDLRVAARSTESSEGLLADEVLAVLRDVCGTHEAVSRVVRFDRARRHYVHVWAIPRRTAKGPAQTTVFLLDVTRLLVETDIVSDVVRQIRHDLSSPLTALRGGIELLLAERLGRLQDPQKKLLRIMGEGAESIVDIVTASKGSDEETAGFPNRDGRRG